MSNDLLSDVHQDDAADPALLLSSDLPPVEEAAEPEVPEEAPTGFAAMNLSQEVRDALEDMGYFTPTPVQAAVFTALHAGKDLLVQSKTGTGKTAAFGLPVLEALDPSKKQVQALILAPTRELAIQVCREIQTLGKYKNVVVEPIYGGAPIGKQIQALRDGVHIVVGTPGRVLDHIGRRTFDTRNIKTFVLDECDEMLSMGFLEDIERVVSHLPKGGFQTALFSATMPDEVGRYARRHMKDAERIALSMDGISVAEIHHAYYIVSGVARTRDLLKILLQEKPEAAIIFCNTRDETAMVARFLQRQGLDAEHISSDLGQKDRERVMQRMKSKNLHYLVATDVAARGIDISDLSHVINYSFPESPEVYVHRTGRTGRAGKKGIALSLIGPRELGSFYMLKLTYKITPEERDLPAAEILEGVLKTSTKHVGAPPPPDPLEVLTAATPGAPNAEQVALAKRVLASEDGERLVAMLVAEKLTALANAKKEAAARAAAEREAQRGGEEDRPRFRDRDDRFGGRDRDRGPREDRPDRGPRGEDRPPRDEDRGERRDFRDRGGEDRPRRDRDDRPRREDGDRPRREEGERRDWREARGEDRPRRDREDRPRRDRDDRPRREDGDRPVRVAGEERPSPQEAREERPQEIRGPGEERPSPREDRPREERGEMRDRDRHRRDRGRGRDRDRPRGDEHPRDRIRRDEQSPSQAPDFVAGETDLIVSDVEAEAAESASREIVADVEYATTIAAPAPAPAPREEGGRRGRRKNGAIAAPPPSPEGNREFWETWAEEKSTRPAPEPAAAPAEEHRESREERPRGDRDRGRDRGRGRDRDRGERRPREDRPAAAPAAARADDPGSLVRLYVSLGKDHGVTADDVRALLGKSLGDDASRIGSVAMRGTHCYVRVPEDLVARITEAVNGTTHNEQEVKVELARA